MKLLAAARMALLLGLLSLSAAHAAAPGPAPARPLDGQNPSEPYQLTRPSVRIAASMVKDTTNQQVLLFGGFGCDRGVCNYLHDTWIWDGRAWTQEHPAASPSGRAAATLVYDPASQQVLLFGGVNCRTDASDSCTDLGDTWTWDGRTWTQQDTTAGPSPRTGTSLAYDPLHQQIVLFGGIACTADACTYDDDTWTWEGQAWTLQQPPTRPTGRTAAALSFDRSLQRIVLVGGRDCPDHPDGDPCHLLDDTWLWDGSTWTEYDTGSQSP